MRRPTKRNLAALGAAIDAATLAGLPYASDLSDLLSRLTDTTDAQPAATGPSAAAIETTLLSSGKLVSAGSNAPSGWWAAQGYRVKKLGATVADAQTLATWMKQQHWLSSGLSLDVVLKNWTNWLVRARAEVKPSGSTTTLEDLA